MQGSKLYVGNLSYSVTNEGLGELFSTYGEVREVNIIEGKGFGFVEMSNPSDAEKAKEGLDGSDFEGRTLKIEEARPPRSRERGEGGGGRPYSGGGGGRPYSGGGGGRPYSGGGGGRPYNRDRQRDEGRPPRDRQRRDSRRDQN